MISHCPLITDMKTLYFTGPTWMFMTPEQMYGEQAKVRSAHKHYQNADIYFLTKMRKVRFNPKKSFITSEGQIHIVLTLGDPTGELEEKVFVFPALELIYTMKHISSQFKNREDFFLYALFHHYKPERHVTRLAHGLARSLLRTKIMPRFGAFLMKWAYGRDIRVTHKNAYEIEIVDPIARQLVNNQKVEAMKTSAPEKYKQMRKLLDVDWDTKILKNVNFQELVGEYERGTIMLTVDQVVNHFEVDVGVQEIIYIGKTERTPFERLLPHEKLQELESKFLRNDKEAIVVHLLGFKEFDVIDGDMKKASVNSEDAITTVEAELINYFKPVQNTNFIDDNRRRFWEHIKKLKLSGYTQIATELDIDGQYTKFATQTIKNGNPNRHCFVTDLKSHQRVVLH